MLEKRVRPEGKISGDKGAEAQRHKGRRSDLDEIVVRLLIGLPQVLAMKILEILSSLAKVWLVYMDVDVIPFLDLLDEVEGFLEMVECVEEDEGRGVWSCLGQHVDADEPCEAKSSRLE